MSVIVHTIDSTDLKHLNWRLGGVSLSEVKWRGCSIDQQTWGNLRHLL